MVNLEKFCPKPKGKKSQTVVRTTAELMNKLRILICSCRYYPAALFNIIYIILEKKRPQKGVGREEKTVKKQAVMDR